jgi:hypothetical protein
MADRWTDAELDVLRAMVPDMRRGDWRPIMRALPGRGYRAIVIRCCCHLGLVRYPQHRPKFVKPYCRVDNQMAAHLRYLRIAHRYFAARDAARRSAPQ